MQSKTSMVKVEGQLEIILQNVGYLGSLDLC